MASTTSTNITDSFKTELLCATHNFSAQINIGAATGTTTISLTGLSSISGVVVGAGVAGTNVAANTVVARLVSQTAMDLSIATTGAPSAILVNGDIFKILMIASGSPGSQAYGQPTQNVGTPGTGASSVTNVGTDEVAASGTYAAGGQVLASNITPSQPGTPAHVSTTSWTVNPSWSSATLSVIGAIIYSTGTTLTGAGAGSATTQPRQGFSANGVSANAGGSAINRAVSVHDFGGTQSVTSGTLTLTLPTNNGTSAILRIA